MNIDAEAMITLRILCKFYAKKVKISANYTSIATCIRRKAGGRNSYGQPAFIRNWSKWSPFCAGASRFIFSLSSARFHQVLFRTVPCLCPP